MIIIFENEKEKNKVEKELRIIGKYLTATDQNEYLPILSNLFGKTVRIGTVIQLNENEHNGTCRLWCKDCQGLEKCQLKNWCAVFRNYKEPYKKQPKQIAYKFKVYTGESSNEKLFEEE